MSVIRADRWKAICVLMGRRPTGPVHEAGLIDDRQALAAAVAATLRAALTTTASSAPRIRAFRHFSVDYVQSERAAQLVPPARRTEGLDYIEEWFSGLSAAGITCAAFNEIDQWSPSATGLLRDELVPAMLGAGLDLRGGIGWYSFIGDSGWTPFGLHTDPEPSLIFHLGPSAKEVWVWNRGERPWADNDRLPARRRKVGRTTDIEPYLAAAPHHYVLAPGDFLYIPEDCVHVFRNSGFSAFLGQALYNFPGGPELPAAESRFSAATLPGSRPGDWGRVGEDIVGFINSGDYVAAKAENELVALSRAHSTANFARREVAEIPPRTSRLIAWPAWLQVSPDGQDLFVNGHQLTFRSVRSAHLVKEALTADEFTAADLLHRFGERTGAEITRALISCGGLAVAGEEQR